MKIVSNPPAPFFKTPFTDLTGTLFTHQEGGKCGALEMKVINCFEAYGPNRAKQRCGDLIDDFHECCSSFKQKARIDEMITERDRQIKSGERSKENAHIQGPKFDSFL